MKQRKGYGRSYGYKPIEDGIKDEQLIDQIKANLEDALNLLNILENPNKKLKRKNTYKKTKEAIKRLRNFN